MKIRNYQILWFSKNETLRKSTEFRYFSTAIFEFVSFVNYKRSYLTIDKLYIYGNKPRKHETLIQDCTAT